MIRVMGHEIKKESLEEFKKEELKKKESISLLELSKNFKDKFSNEIILAKVNNRLKDLSEILDLKNDYDIEFLDISDQNGFRAYQRSVVFLMIYAVKLICGKKTRVIIEHSVNKNYYCEIENIDINNDFLLKLESEMHEAIKKNFEIQRKYLTRETALNITKEFGEDVDRFKFNRNSNISFYKLDWYYDYYYAPLLPSLKYIKGFLLHKRLNGFMIQFPCFNKPYEFENIKPREKISSVFMEYSHWLKIMNLETVNSLNKVICSGKTHELINLSETLHENKIVNIAQAIQKKLRQIVLIGGPTSSGKTTFANRLCINLKANGLHPYVISLDDYFLDRDKVPIDKNGKKDFECLEASDINRLNYDLKELLNHKTVEIPKFNFITGESQRSNRYIKLNKGDVLILEGIHGLNEKLTKEIDREKKFKIFISALTQLNLDDHNRISTTDTRLVRRIVRDNQYRGFSAKDTINMWQSVVHGENNYIFPYQEEADMFFNSALVYEMSVLKQFAEPLLFDISDLDSEYCEANRLTRFLNSFLGIDTRFIPRNSILREFIGGSCFY